MFEISARSKSQRPLNLGNVPLDLSSFSIKVTKGRNSLLNGLCRLPLINGTVGEGEALDFCSDSITIIK